MRLSAENIRFRYTKERTILKNIHFHMDSGEVVGLTGSSGAGKTTLGKILAGYQKPERGTVLIDGKAIDQGGFCPVQLIFQHPEKAVNPKWKMRKILEEAGMPSEQLMVALGIQKEWLNRWPGELSGGELQRFCVIRALSERTQFIIADEMTAMLDAITQAQIWQAVLEYAKLRHIGILVISHDSFLMDKICSRKVSLTHLQNS
ncbi:ABC transporter ATP-binding protein [Aminipila luticellarii]|uniref:ATP-binding cassette domain-containing protein n=1 Tax=Aminipila luticellarii TaxID=2507160 RepID=A0A410PUS4_9FIRM|nr:ATP-binding cassette domain-containing protein [Aminipila luticellarii]QAT42675.1 ATP-binding cassette domain-containing protein [Aminipila luticellarii]